MFAHNIYPRSKLLSMFPNIRGILHPLLLDLKVCIPNNSSSSFGLANIRFRVRTNNKSTSR